MEADDGEVMVLPNPSLPSRTQQSMVKPTYASASSSSLNRRNSPQSANTLLVVDDSDSEDDCVELSGDSIRKLKQPRYKSPRATVSYDLTKDSSEGSSKSRYLEAKSPYSSSDDVVLLSENSAGTGVISRAKKRRARAGKHSFAVDGSSSNRNSNRDAGKKRKYPTSSNSNPNSCLYGYAYPNHMQQFPRYQYRQNDQLHSGYSAGYHYGSSARTNAGRASCIGASRGRGYSPYSAAGSHGYDPYAFTAGAASQVVAPRYQYNARSLRGPSKAKLRALLSSGRDFTAEDYETLLQLDESTKKKGLSLEEIGRACATTFMKRIPKDSSCSICLSPFTQKQKIAILAKCMHKFHNRCITKWLRQKNMCPICQQKVI